jgi:hypothetical protein
MLLTIGNANDVSRQPILKPLRLTRLPPPPRRRINQKNLHGRLLAALWRGRWRWPKNPKAILTPFKGRENWDVQIATGQNKPERKRSAASVQEAVELPDGPVLMTGMQRAVSDHS